MTPPATTRYSSDLSTIPFVCCSLLKPVHSIMAFTHGIFFVFLCCAGPLCEVRALASTYIVSSNTELSKALAATVKGGDKLIINVENNDEKARKMSAVVCGGSKCCYFLSKQLEVSQGTVEINGNGEGCILAAHGHSRIFSVKSGTLIVNDITLKHGRQDVGGAVYLGGEGANFRGRNIVFEDNAVSIVGGAAYVSSFSIFECDFCEFLNNRGGIHETYGASIFLQREALIKCNSCEFEKGFSRSSEELAAIGRQFHIAHAEDFDILSDL